jgi:nucleoside-diphosphate-sugar epimerase
MRILIIGNGLLGTAIVQRLESEGHSILIFARRRNDKIQSRQVLGDIFLFSDFIKVLDWKPEVIVHTAWITTPGIYQDAATNIQYQEFTTNLAKIVKGSDIKHLLILGTCAEYGHQAEPSTAGITKLTPSTLYAQQKVAAFSSTRELLQDSNIRFTWARVFYPYGPGQDRNRLIPRLIGALRDRKPIALIDTSSVYDWITTRDIAFAISWIIENVLPMEIDIGTSLGYTNLELLIELEDILGARGQLSLSGAHEVGLKEVFVTDRKSPLLISGWSPEDSLHSGLGWMLRQ